MKTRTSFVSNSSSSSFIIIGEEPRVPSAKLNYFQAGKVIKYLEKLYDRGIDYDGVSDVFLTPYITDGANQELIGTSYKVHLYSCGDYGRPYGREYDIILYGQTIWLNVWIRREHNLSVKMNVSKGNK